MLTKTEFLTLADILYPKHLDISFYMNKYKPRNTTGEITRLGPSPTGFLHIGHVFGAFIDKLLADSSKGSFYLRLEDTDQKREIKDAGNIAYNMLCKFDLRPDEGYTGGADEIGEYGPYVQSERLEIYQSFAKEMVKKGRAFPCFCEKNEGKDDVLERRKEQLSDSENLDSKDPCRNLTLKEIQENIAKGKLWALRLKSEGDPEKTFVFNDRIKGERQLRENDRDIVLMKNNGIPPYAFAHVVDDTLMHTTTVVRGEDWYPSLSSHLEIFDALGLKAPKYAHTPNICKNGEDGNKRKLSKRKDPEADARYFLKEGYPVIAVLEYLLNLINSDFELWRIKNPDLNFKEFDFSLAKISVSNPMFDFSKLNNISKTIISRFTSSELYDNALEWAKIWNNSAFEILSGNKEAFIQIFSLGRGVDRPRKDVTSYSEIIELYNYILTDFKLDLDIDIENVDKDKLIKFLENYMIDYKQANDNQEWFEDLKTTALNHNFVDNKTYKAEPGKYAGNITDISKFVRFAITARTESPELHSIMCIIGEQETKKRLKNLIQLLKQK